MNKNLYKFSIFLIVLNILMIIAGLSIRPVYEGMSVITNSSGELYYRFYFLCTIDIIALFFVIKGRLNFIYVLLLTSSAMLLSMSIANEWQIKNTTSLVFALFYYFDILILWILHKQYKKNNNAVL